MFVNTHTYNDCLIMDRFISLLDGLSQSQTNAPELLTLVVNIAKHNNKHSVCDKYMRSFAKILMSRNDMMAKKLEVLLNSEIAIKKPVEAEVVTTFESQPLHPNILS